MSVDTTFPFLELCPLRYEAVAFCWSHRRRPRRQEPGVHLPAHGHVRLAQRGHGEEEARRHFAVMHRLRTTRNCSKVQVYVVQSGSATDINANTGVEIIKQMDAMIHSS